MDYNSRVSKGQIIARIDARLYAAEVAKARASLATAKANLQKSEAAARPTRPARSPASGRV